MTFNLEVLLGNYVISKMERVKSVPEWTRGEFVSVTQTPDELSIVCPDRNLPDDLQSESGWQCLRLTGKLDFSLVGVIADITKILADADVSTFVMSTFDHDYLLVRELDLDCSTAAWMEAGYLISIRTGPELE